MGKTVYNPGPSVAPSASFPTPRWRTRAALLHFRPGSHRCRGTSVGRGDIRLQTRQVLHNIQAALEPVGGALEDIACINVFLVNMEHLQAVHEVRAPILE